VNFDRTGLREGCGAPATNEHASRTSYNEERGIEPKTILKDIHNPLVRLSQIDYYDTGQIQVYVE
jgi:hypothetical protein